MNNLSNRLTDCRSRLLDAEALLHHLHKPENLNDLLESDSPEITLGAMIDKAWRLVAEARGDCESMCETHDDAVKAVVRNVAAEHHHAIRKPEQASPADYSQPLDTIDLIHEQTRSMLLMMLAYLEQARGSGAKINGVSLENYVGQMMSNMDQAVEASCALSESLEAGVAR